MFWNMIDLGSFSHQSIAEVAQALAICRRIKQCFGGCKIASVPIDNAARAVVLRVAEELKKDDCDRAFMSLIPTTGWTSAPRMWQRLLLWRVCWAKVARCTNSAPSHASMACA